MIYTVKKSFIHVLGYIWMPSVQCSQRIDLRQYDIDNMRNDEGTITRDDVENWLGSNAGDFSSITDFYASIEDGNTSIEIAWNDEENEFTFNDNMYAECE
jgi:hypothetical protein